MLYFGEDHVRDSESEILAAEDDHDSRQIQFG